MAKSAYEKAAEGLAQGNPFRVIERAKNKPKPKPRPKPKPKPKINNTKKYGPNKVQIAKAKGSGKNFKRAGGSGRKPYVRNARDAGQKKR